MDNKTQQYYDFIDFSINFLDPKTHLEHLYDHNRYSIIDLSLSIWIMHNFNHTLCFFYFQVFHCDSPLVFVFRNALSEDSKELASINLSSEDSLPKNKMTILLWAKNSSFLLIFLKINQNYHSNMFHRQFAL